MRQRFWKTLVGLGYVLLLGTMIDVVMAKAIAPPTPPMPLQIGHLTHHQSVVGAWDRIEFPEAVLPVNWCNFSASGTMASRYGDTGYQGSYRILDKQTIEIRYHFFERKDEVHRWTFGFENGNLLMIHQKYGWVEKHRMVPAATLRV